MDVSSTCDQALATCSTSLPVGNYIAHQQSKIAESRTGKKMSESIKKRISKSKKTRKGKMDEKKAELNELVRRYNIVSDEEYSDES